MADFLPEPPGQFQGRGGHHRPEDHLESPVPAGGKIAEHPRRFVQENAGDIYEEAKNINEERAAAAEAAASEPTEVGRQAYDDCDGSGHGYYEITYSDGSVGYEEY